MIAQSCLLIETKKFPIMPGEDQEIVNERMYGNRLVSDRSEGMEAQDRRTHGGKAHERNALMLQRPQPKAESYRQPRRAERDAVERTQRMSVFVRCTLWQVLLSYVVHRNRHLPLHHHFRHPYRFRKVYLGNQQETLLSHPR